MAQTSSSPSSSFNTDDYFAFADRAAVAAGIDVPVIPGILPVLSAPQILAASPPSAAPVFRPASTLNLTAWAKTMRPSASWGSNTLRRQVEELWAKGVPGVHFYVLNRSYSVSKILDYLGIPGHIPD